MAYVKIRPRRGSKSQWEYANPILSEGEIAFEVPDTGVGTGTVNFKMGDGTTSYNALAYAFNAASLNDKVDTLSNRVSTYDTRITTMETKVNQMSGDVGSIRRIDIQSSTPDSSVLLSPGQIWINAATIRGTMSIYPTMATIAVGGTPQTFSLNKSIDFPNVDAVEWTANPTNIARLEEMTADGCKAVPLNNGVTTITATAIVDGAPIYKVQARLTVEEAGSITITPAGGRVIVGKDLDLVVTTTIENYDSIEFTSSIPAYATVEKVEGTLIVGRVHGVSCGDSSNTTITVRAIKDGRTIAESSCNVEVVGMMMNTTALPVTVGDDQTISLTITMNNPEEYNKIVWQSDDTNVATVSNGSATGVTVSGVASGTCYIIAKAQKETGIGTETHTIEDVMTLRCRVSCTGYIRLNPKNSNLIVGSPDGKGDVTIQVENTLGGTANEIAWATSDTSSTYVEMTANDNGAFIHSVAANGSVMITVIAKNNNVEVARDNAFITTSGDLFISPKTPQVVNGGTLALNLTNTLPNDSYTNIDWATNLPNIVEIVTSDNTSCTVRGKAVGAATITCRALNRYIDPDTGSQESETVAEVSVQVNVTAS